MINFFAPAISFFAFTSPIPLTCDRAPVLAAAIAFKLLKPASVSNFLVFSPTPLKSPRENASFFIHSHTLISIIAGPHKLGTFDIVNALT